MSNSSVAGRLIGTFSAPIVVSANMATATVVFVTPTAVFSGTEMEQAL